MIWSIVLNQLISYIIQAELSFGDSIREASDQSTEVAWIVDVFGERFVPEHHIARLAVPVGHDNRRDGATIVGDTHFNAIAFEGIKKGLVTFWCGAEVVFGDVHENDSGVVGC